MPGKRLIVLLHKIDSRAHDSVETINWMCNTTVKALRTVRSLYLVILQQREALASQEYHSERGYIEYFLFQEITLNTFCSV